MTTGSVPPRAAKSRRWVLVLVGIVAGGMLVLLGTVFVGMPLALGHRNDVLLERTYANFAVDMAVGSQAGNLTNPLANNPRALESGRVAYTGSCAQCHGANGDGKGAFGQALYPPASDLRGGDTQEKSDAKLYWIIKNGLSFVGMPGFGDQYKDQDLWALVAYTRALGKGGASALAVPTPTADQLAKADANGDAVARGAAVYFAQACSDCHGPVGNAPGQLGLRANAREVSQALRQGRAGMPVYSAQQISDTQLSDLIQYMVTFTGRGGG